MKENILILGAGLIQTPAIEAAKKYGNAVVIDADPNAVSVPLADEFYPVDLKDREGILNLAKKLNSEGNILKGIFTAGTDFSASVSYAGEKLGMNCHSFQAALNASNKNIMRKCFADSNVPSPAYKVLNQNEYSPQTAGEIAESIGFPCVVKPCDNMGARGCRTVRNQKEIISAVEDGFKYSRSHNVIIEQFMDGPEFSIDALVYENTVTITGFADRHIYFPPYFIETGHTMPSEICDEKKHELIKTFVQGIKALGLTCGAAKADIKYTSKGPMVGEIAARLSGGYMSGWTFPYSSNFNLTEEALKIACGIVPDKLLSNRIPLNIDSDFKIYEIPSINCSAERAWISIPGKIKEILHTSELSSVPAVKNYLPRNVKPGDEVDFPRNNVSKCGNIISLAPSISEAKSVSEKAASSVIIRLEPDNKKTEDFLNSVQQDSEKDFPPDAYSFYKEVKNLTVEGEIPSGTMVSKNIPENLKKYFSSSEKNWNYLTLMESLELFDKLCPDHGKIPADKFWKALFRGGIQSIIYVSDSFSDNK